MVAKVLPWLITGLLSIAFPIVVYDLATDRGVPVVGALLLSGVGPAIEMLGTALVRRRLDEFSLFVLVLLVISLVTAFLFDDPRLLLLREAAVTGLFGLVLLGSLFAPRPMMFLFGRRFATNGTPEGVAWWNGLWRYPGFRRTQYGLTTMWGVTLVVEAVVRVVLTYELSVATMVVLNAVVPPLVILGLVVATVLWVRRSRSAGEQRSTEAADGGPGEHPAPAPAA